MAGILRPRRLLAPEVVQTSAMDCGPAALKCLLEGFGIPVSYGRLREACQTDVNGTSIDTIEDIARQLRLDAAQVMLPVDHLLLPEAEALPALVVVKLPSGFTHFIVLWRRHGPWVQVMDPRSGRHWASGAQLLRDLYVHKLRIPSVDWYAWARSNAFLAPLARRLADLGLKLQGKRLISEAVGASEWRALATLDAGTRLVSSLVRAEAIRPGREAQPVLQALLERAANTQRTETGLIPERYWSVRPALPAPGEGDAPVTEELILQGAVLVVVRGPLAAEGHATSQMPGAVTAGRVSVGHLPQEPPLSPELAVALAESPSRPGRELLQLLRGDGVLAFVVLGGGLAIAAGSLLLEALLLRSIIDIGHDLGLVTQRLEAAGCFLVFALALLLIELRVVGSLLRLGRRLETRLRLALLAKIPRLVNRYFQSRPVSDMAERSHSLHQLRLLPRLGGQLVRAVLALVLTGAALVWLYPAGALLASLAVFLAIGLPLFVKPHLEELDLRVRTHTGALGRFYLDALLGLTTVRAHGAERAVRREHEGLLVEWTQASLGLIRTVVVLEGLQAVSGLGLAAWLLFGYGERFEEPAGALLLAYWALYLPVLGDEVALLVRQYPIHRNLTLRLFEPLGAPEADPTVVEPSRQDREEEPGRAPGSQADQARTGRKAGIAVAFESVTVRAAGHTILQNIDLSVEPASHIAIVGASGAGKSSLVGLLLGWHRAATGQILVDGHLVDPGRLDRLRAETVWVDPAVQLWNRSLLSNLCYGTRNSGRLPFAEVLDDLGLYDLLQRLPDGLQTHLGEGGGLISGGEGQRVRLGRGMLRPGARLVILDEPFRGLERAQRRALLTRVRRLWREATLLCITHDLQDTGDFPRVLVIAAGRVVEDGSPKELAADPGSHYRALIEGEQEVARKLWSSPIWRRQRLEAGRLSALGNSR